MRVRSDAEDSLAPEPAAARGRNEHAHRLGHVASSIKRQLPFGRRALAPSMRASSPSGAPTKSF